MLDYPDDNKWESLGYPDMGTWLDNLRSENVSVQKQALDELYNTHITEISKVSLYLVPSLIELLKNDKIQVKCDLINLLMHIADSIGPHRALGNVVLSRIEDETDLYLTFLESEETRYNAFELLGYLSGRFEQIASKLLPMIEPDSDKIASSYTLYHLLNITENIDEHLKQECITRFLELFRSAEDYYVRGTAMMALSRLMGDKAPAEVDELFEKMLTKASTEKRGGFGVVSLVKALLQLGTVRATKILINSLPNIDDLYNLLPIFLNLGFNKGKVIQYSNSRIRMETGIQTIWKPLSPMDIQPIIREELNSTQRQILHVIINHDNVWASTSNIFQLHGLPSSREALQKLLV